MIKRSFLSVFILIGLMNGITKAECIQPDCSNGCTVEIINQHGMCVIKEQQDLSVKYLYKIGATKYNSLDAFRVNDYITRQEAAKFFSVAYKELNKQTEINDCILNDEMSIDSTLLEYVKDVCKKGIMKGSKNNFMGKSFLTMRQTFVMIYRMKIGIENENISPRYKNYDFTKLPYLEGNIKSIAGWWEGDINNIQITRGQMADILYYALTQ